MLLSDYHVKLESGVQMSGFSCVSCCLLEFVIWSFNTTTILSTSLLFKGYFFHIKSAYACFELMQNIPTLSRNFYLSLNAT